MYQISEQEYRLIPPYLDFVGNAKYRSLPISKLVNDNPNNTILNLILKGKLDGYLPVEIVQAEQGLDLVRCDVW